MKIKAAEAKEEVAGMKRKLKEGEKEVTKAKKQLEKEVEKGVRQAEKLVSIRAEKKKDHDLLLTYQKKGKDAKEKPEKADDVNQLQRQLEEETRKNVALTTENEMLRGLLEEKEEDIEKLEEEQESEIDMMDPNDRRNYKPEVVNWVWELQEANVADHQIPKVIKSSMKFFGKRASQIPSSRIVGSMGVSTLSVSQKHMKVLWVSSLIQILYFTFLLFLFIFLFLNDEQKTNTYSRIMNET